MPKDYRLSTLYNKNMKRFLFIIVAYLSICSFMPFDPEIYAGDFSDLNGRSANLEIEYTKIHNRTEAEFAEYEKDWSVDKPEVEGLILAEANKALKGKCRLSYGKDEDLTVRIVVKSISVKGDYDFYIVLLDKNKKELGTIRNIFARGGMFGTKLNLIKDGAKNTGRRTGTLLKKYMNM